MIKLVIFDFDGVIADTLGLAVKTVNSMLLEEGYERRLCVADIREKGLKGLIKEFKVPIYKVPFYMHRSRDIVGREIDSVKAFTGMKAVMSRLSEDYKLAIVTSNSKENVNRFLKNNGMDGIFDFIIAGVGIFGKSSKIKNAIKIAKVKEAEAICVGDELRDIEAARKASVRIICAGWGFNSRKLLEGKKPDYIADEPSELNKIIFKMP